MTAHKLIEASLAVYAVLLHLYPRDFHRAYGALMTQLLRDQCKDAVAQRGRLGLLAVWLRTLLDFAVTAFQEHLHAAAGVGLTNEPVTPLPWRQVLLAILPGVLMMAERAGFQPWSSASLSPVWRHRLIVDSWFWASIALVVWSLLRHRRLAVWAYPAAGILLWEVPVAVTEALFALPPLSLWERPVRWILMLTVPVAGLIVLWKHRHGLRASTFTWISMAMLAISSAPALFLPALYLALLVLPAATGLTRARRDRVSGVLLALRGVWFWVSHMLDPTFRLHQWAIAYAHVRLIGLLPPLFIMILPVVGVLRARTTYRQLMNFISTPFLGMVVMYVWRWALFSAIPTRGLAETIVSESLNILQVTSVVGLVALTYAQYDHGRPYVTEHEMVRHPER